MTANMYDHTPAPWYWHGNAGSKTLYLAAGSKRKFVMQFARWGTQGAQPRFEVNMRMVDAKDLVQFEVGNPDVVGVDAAKNDPSVYRLDITGISHPDAILIAAAPDLLKERDALKAANAEFMDILKKVSMSAVCLWIENGRKESVLSSGLVDEVRALIQKHEAKQ